MRMKNALILHGISNDHTGNWFPWLTSNLQKEGFEVFSPDLPRPERPNIERCNEFLFSHWTPNAESILIGHSSGAVEILGYLQALPMNIVVSAVYLVAGFTDPLGDEKSELFLHPYDYKKIRKSAKKFILFHSDNDPYVPLSHGEHLRDLLDAELIVIPGQGHFNLEKGPEYKEFPQLLGKILE